MGIMQLLIAGAGTPPPSFSYLVVAGGGAVGGSWGNPVIVVSTAGGGAGGFLEGDVTNEHSSYVVTVGAAGLYVGQNGGNSRIESGTVTLVDAYGGGCGALGDGFNGADGGSGGGGYGYADAGGARGGTGIPGQGHDGGYGWRALVDSNFYTYGGGGGGAGGPGTNTSPTGGPRKNSMILTSSNSSYLYGFAGGGQNNNTEPGDQGRSGIVAIKYGIEYKMAIVTGSPQMIVDGSSRIYVWTGSGSFSF